MPYGPTLAHRLHGRPEGMPDWVGRVRVAHWVGPQSAGHVGPPNVHLGAVE